MMLRRSRPAGIQYMGLPGISSSCLRAVERLLLAGEQIEQVTLLTAGQTHALLLRIEPLETIAVKSGFSSGYPGEGPRTLSATLRLLDAFGVDIEEVEVSEALIERLDESALTDADIVGIEKAEPVRPMRWFDYLLPSRGRVDAQPSAVASLPAVMPWGVLDERLVSAALGFENNPDHALLVGFRQLEDIVRARLKKEVGEGRVFVEAFVGERSKLMWEKTSAGEHSARGQLFAGAYTAFRNPRAHGLEERQGVSELQEFMLLNLLYTLERSATERPASEDEADEPKAQTQKRAQNKVGRNQ